MAAAVACLSLIMSHSEASSQAPAQRLNFCDDLFYSPRPLRQYVCGDTHISHSHPRSIGFDELFFDLS